MNLPNDISHMLGQRQTRAVVAGLLILCVIAVLQYVSTTNSSSLVALLESKKLKEGDLERMEFAIGAAGINGCKIQNGQLMVPQHCREQCLAAIASSETLPQFLRTESETRMAVNPFLSRSQQKQVQQQEKKRQIRDMVLRLPFVEDAWFEMDVAASGSAFQPARATAVVSVEPPMDVVLDSDQVATLREMIAGAVAGLNAESISVVDVVSGYAHRHGGSNAGFVSVDQRPPFEQETYYRKRIQQAVKAFGDIDVQVRVDMVEEGTTLQAVSHVAPVENRSAAAVEKAKETSRERFTAVIGTNGSASIHNVEPPKVEPRLEPVKQITVAAKPNYSSRVEVSLQVPESIASRLAIGKDAFPEDKPNIKQQAVNRLGRQLVDVVRPILPKTSFAQGTPFPISVQFTPQVTIPSPAVPTWEDRFKALASKHWPSLAVLLFGLVLLTMMTRGTHDDVEVEELMDEDIISINQPEQADDRGPEQLPEVAIAQPEDYARRAAEQRLGTLVENDPDSAARVIESWIRKAG